MNFRIRKVFDKYYPEVYRRSRLTFRYGWFPVYRDSYDYCWSFEQAKRMISLYLFGPKVVSDETTFWQKDVQDIKDLL